MANGFNVPDGNDALRADIPAIVELIERTARWVHPDTFRALPVWAPHTARGRPLYDAAWARRYTNTRKATGLTAEKFEGNVAALNALVAALDVSSPKPRNWTVCHIWGYDDPSFAERSSVVQDPRYFSCVANMIWLPTSLKGFTDTLPEIKAMLRVCADLATADAEPVDGRVARWAAKLAPWAEQAREFRNDGFYERFPAKGQVERVARIHRDLNRLAGITAIGRE